VGLPLGRSREGFGRANQVGERRNKGQTKKKIDTGSSRAKLGGEVSTQERERLELTGRGGSLVSTRDGKLAGWKMPGDALKEKSGK